MTDALLKALSSTSSLRSLNLDGCNSLTDEGITPIFDLKELRKLTLGGWHSQLSDTGLKGLANLTELREFQLCWARRITDAGVAGLKNCDRLQSVNLLGTPTGDAALTALKTKPELRKVKTGQLLTNDGLDELQELPAFLSDPEKSAEFGLFSFEAEPTDLLIDGEIDDEGLKKLNGLNGLRGLSLFWHVSRVTSRGIESLAGLPKLEFLGLGGALCDDRAMEAIASHPGLRMLQGQEAIASNAGFKSFSKSATIEYLWGRECPNFSNEGFASLSTMPRLTGLGISLRKVDAEALSSLRYIRSLRTLMPMGLTDDEFKYVGECTGLEELSCMYCRETGDRATEHLGGLSNLRSYYAGQTRITDVSLALLADLDSLESITLSQCAGISTAGVARLSRLPHLKSLVVSGSPLVDQHVEGEFPPEVTICID